MATTESDDRSSARRAQDEKIATEPPWPLLDLPKDAVPSPMEAHRDHSRRPVAIVGVIENGVVHPLDPAVTLPEHARVIVFTSECS